MNAALTDGPPDARTGFRPDPALPQRDLLLDGTWVRDLLSRRLGLDGPLDVRLVGDGPVRAKYRLGESLRVTYRLDTPRGTATVSARTFPAPRSDEAYAKAARRAVAVPGLDPVLHDRDHGTVWWTLPNDRRLRGAAQLLHPGPTPLLPLRGWCRSTLAEFAAERSLTVRAEDGDGDAVGYVKLFAPGSVDVAGLVERYRRLSAALACPRPLLAGADVLVLQPLPGRTLAQLPQAEHASALGELGVLIARLHDQPLTAATAPFERLEARRVRHSAELVGLVRPDCAALAEELVVRLARRPLDRGAPVTLHGDCHPKNALVHGGAVSLIDLDQSGAGPAAADLGSLLARLEHGTIVGEYDAEHATSLGVAFLEGYRSVRPLPDTGVLRSYTAAALVAERAIRAVNRVDLTALAHLDALLTSALDLLET